VIDRCSLEKELVCTLKKPAIVSYDSRGNPLPIPSPQQGQTDGSCRCKLLGRQERSWSTATENCLLSIDETCREHKHCISTFCSPDKKCVRQRYNGQPCPTGQNEECESGFCDQKKKVCASDFTSTIKPNRGTKLSLPSVVACTLILSIILVGTGVLLV
jgi:hypothetical protein